MNKHRLTKQSRRRSLSYRHKVEKIGREVDREFKKFTGYYKG